jgi:CO/xanthine dehydrogenase Mo-binding subunit
MNTVTDHKLELKIVGTRPVRPDGVDKVTGRAAYGADVTLPGALIGRILRSPHAHARIKSINVDAARALDGVKAVVTSEDFGEVSSAIVFGGEGQTYNYRKIADNLLARGKVLYEGHAIAAVAATSLAAADRALKLIKIEYEVLPHVIDVEAAMSPDAPVLHDDLFTSGVEPAPTKPSNIASIMTLSTGDVDEGFKEADIIVERTFITKTVHQGYIEPHACIASYNEDGQAVVYCSSQGQFEIRASCAALLGMGVSEIRVVPLEIGGGFGGKIPVYLEPVALLLSRKAGRPIKMTMTREEEFKATGPTSGGTIYAKIGVKRDGKIVAAQSELKFQAGAFPGSPVIAGCMTMFTPYNIANVRTVGYDVVSNGPKVAAYRAPAAPQGALAVECILDELAQKMDMDPLRLREINAVGDGARTVYGASFGAIGFKAVLEAVRKHPHYSAQLGKNQGRGIASGFWFNAGGDSTATVSLNADGTAIVTLGTPDIGGQRASQAMMAAEILGIPYEQVRPVVADSSSVGFNMITGGSRVTFSVGTVVVQAARKVVDTLRERAAKIWDIDPDAVTWKSGAAVPAGANAGNFAPLTVKELAGKMSATGGPISATASQHVSGAGPAFGTHLCDVEVDPDTGRVTVLRYTVVQDAGKAIHPSYVEGQFQGGAAQGIGWALNEAYIYDDAGRLQNAGFLDYRIPVTSDLPMIDTVIVEIPSSTHPFGARGVGECPIVPPLAAVTNAVSRAIGKRMLNLPLSPPNILAAIQEP